MIEKNFMKLTLYLSVLQTLQYFVFKQTNSMKTKLFVMNKNEFIFVTLSEYL